MNHPEFPDSWPLDFLGLWNAQIRRAVDAEVFFWLSQGYTTAELVIQFGVLRVERRGDTLIIAQDYSVNTKTPDDPGFYQGAGI